MSKAWIAGVVVLAACGGAPPQAPSSTCTFDDGPSLHVTGRADGVYGVVGDQVEERPLAALSDLRLTGRGVDERSSKRWIAIDIAGDAARALRDFTAVPEGKSIVLVLGGEAASRHKVRVPLNAASFQVSCCDSRACDRWEAMFSARDDGQGGHPR